MKSNTIGFPTDQRKKAEANFVCKSDSQRLVSLQAAGRVCAGVDVSNGSTNPKTWTGAVSDGFILQRKRLGEEALPSPAV